MLRSCRGWTALAASALGLAVALTGCATPTRNAGPASVGSVAAIGDSISLGFDACSFLQPCPATSWATGTDPRVNSHYQRLLARNPTLSGRTYNVAQVGANSANLAAQSAAVAAHRPDYVTILIGANDACAASEAQMTPRTVFRNRVAQALTTIYAARPDTHVLVASIPDLYRLWQVGHTNRTAQLVWSAGFCRTMLDNPTSTAPADEARRRRVQAQVVGYNADLAAACRQHPTCRSDGNAVFDYPFAVSDLSPFDYFHPNPAGQRTLAAITWAKSGL